MSEDYDIIEPSSAEQYLWPEVTQSYVRDLQARIERLEAENAKLKNEIVCVGVCAMFWICVLCLII